MGAAYSVDLRRKVVEACERGTASQAQVAQFFGVSVSFVEKLLRLHRRTEPLSLTEDGPAVPHRLMRPPAPRCSVGWKSRTTSLWLN